MTYWLTKPFKDLQAEWYARLEADGFEDAEVSEELIAPAGHCYQGISDVEREAKETYFAQLSHLVETQPFDNFIDRIILNMYANGAKKTDIALALKKMPPRRPPHYVSDLYRSRKTVWYRIRVYEMRWGLRPLSSKYFEGYSQPGNRHKKVG